MKKILILLLALGFILTIGSCQRVRNRVQENKEEDMDGISETSPVDEAYWYWDYNVKWKLCTINGEQFENIFFIWTNLGQTIVDEDGNALFMSEMNIERCEGVVEKIVYDSDEMPEIEPREE